MDLHHRRRSFAAQAHLNLAFSLGRLRGIEQKVENHVLKDGRIHGQGDGVRRIQFDLALAEAVVMPGKTNFFFQDVAEIAGLQRTFGARPAHAG